MVTVPLIFVCIWSALMFGVGFFMHRLTTPKVGYIHIEQNKAEDHDKFAIEFTRDPTELYSLHEVMLKIKFKEVSKENSLVNETNK